MDETTPSYRPDPAWEADVDALIQEPYMQECVALLRAGMSWHDALSLEPHERQAVLRIYAAQEEASWEEAQRRAKEQPQAQPARQRAVDEEAG